MDDTPQKLTFESYEKIAPAWNDRNFIEDFWLEEYAKFKLHLPAGKVLDVGCGGGRDAVWFLKNGYDYLGVDFSPAMIAQARKACPQAKFAVMDASDLKFNPESFDGVWAAVSLLHFPKNDISDVLAGICEVMKTGGVGFVSLKKGEGEKIEIGQEDGERFLAYYQENEFKDFLQTTGLSVIETWEKRTKHSDQVYLCFLFKK
jgi:ubiquinone/menaquinone biosynthesis C-methylase UbiE